ncbi:hypothetical protein MNBD_GAMMA11-1942 [hydrothermal vent metagenome]|uniref:Uncharacterized protein n=1 Tax=hydrothermal vent metagenome TaxID=652676 RepID=A0A3B0XE75_9ZZZZ
MNLTVCAKICKECPFSKNSPRGWLGSHTFPDVLAAQHAGKLFSCHLQRQEGMTPDDIETGKVPICRGYLVSAAKSNITLDKDAENGLDLSQLQAQVMSENREDISTILSQQEFKEHHVGPAAADRIPVSQEIIDKRRGLRP